MVHIPKPYYFYRSTGQDDFEFVRPVMGSFNSVAVRKAHIYPKHQHLNYQLIFAQRGCYRCVLNGSPLELNPKDVLFIKRGDWHEDVCGLGLRYLAINFDLSGNKDARAADIIFKANVKPEQQVIRGPNTEIWRLLKRMQTEPRHGDHLVAHIENSLLQQLFWSLIRALPQDRVSPIFLRQFVPQAFSERLRQLFNDHLSGSLSTVAIAEQFGVSVRTLTQRCREVVGRPPARAFMHHKMDCAAQALRQSEISIKEISHRLGFQNQYHFSHVFRRYFGTRPSSYRGLPK